MTSTPQFKCNKVMVIDDNAIDLFLVDKFLKRSFFSNDVHSFQSAKKAVDFLSKPGITSAEMPSVIFLDINMPEMNGFEFLDAFAQLNSFVKHNIDIIMLTSSDDPKDLQKANDNPHVVLYLHKPLSIEKLHAINIIGFKEKNIALLIAV